MASEDSWRRWRTRSLGPSSREWRAPEWVTRLDLELGLLRTAEHNTRAAAEYGYGDEPPPPIPDMRKEVVASRSLESLDETIPAPVATARGQHHLETSSSNAGRCLD